jgi:hypothetical protein
MKLCSRGYHIKENLYISYAGLLLQKYSPWKRDFNIAIAQMRAGNKTEFRRKKT